MDLEELLVKSDPDLQIPDPFPSPLPPRPPDTLSTVPAPPPIIPVDEEDVEDPDTGMVHALANHDSRGAEKLARQKLRATSQKMQKVERQMTPPIRPNVPEPPEPKKD